MELEGEAQFDGPWVDSTVGLKGVPCRTSP